MTPSDRALVRAVELLGEIGENVRCAVVVTDAASSRAHRRIMFLRVVGFALGAALAVAWGIGWLVIVAAVVAHQLLFNVHRLLAATDEGLVLADIGFRRAAIVARWAVGTDASVVLRSNDPRAAVTVEPALDNHPDNRPDNGPDNRPVIEAWTGHISGTDLDGFETTIRAAGGEPLRRTAID